MKKIFTKLSLFALALLGGTQVAVAEEHQAGSSSVGTLKWSTDNNNYQNVVVTGDDATLLTYTQSRPLYLEFTFDKQISKSEIVKSAVLDFDLSQTGSNVETYIALGNEMVVTEEYSGGRPVTTPKEHPVTVDVTELLKKYVQNSETDITKVVFEFTSSSDAISKILLNNGLPYLYVDCDVNNPVSYSVKMVDENGKEIGFKSNIGEGNVGNIVDLTKDTKFATYTKSFYSSDRANQYVYNATGTYSKTSMKLVAIEEGKENPNVFVLCFTTNAVAFNLKLNKYPYSTYVNSEYDLNFSNNPLLEAYVVTVHPSNAEWLSMKKVEQVPAGVPVMLKYLGNDASDEATTSATATVTVDIVDNANMSSSLVSANLLKVFTEDKSASALWEMGTPYVLSAGGFAKVASSADGVLAAGKACVILPNAQTSRFTLVEEDEATAVAEAEAQTAVENVIYNMQGVRVQSATAPGLYIINGKKVLVK